MTTKIPSEYLTLRQQDDFGFSAVDEADLKVTVDENTLEPQIIRETLSTSSESLTRVEAKLDQILDLYNNGKLGLDTEKQAVQAKLTQIEQMVMPLLVNLMKNPEKEYIYWPNRTGKLQEQIDKILSLTRGA